MSRLQLIEKEYGRFTQKQLDRAELYTILHKLKRNGCLLFFKGHPEIPCIHCPLDTHSEFKKILISIDAAFVGSCE